MTRKFLIRRFSLIVVLWGAYAMRLFQLGQQSLRGDEAASALYATFDLAKIINISRLADPHPPTFYLGLHYWEWLTGLSDFALRLWVVVPAILTVAAMYTLGRRLVDVRSGIFAALLLAFNSFHGWHSQDLRNYTWLIFWGLAASLALWAVSYQPRRRAWLVYAALLLALIYTHYYALFIIAFHGVFMLWWGWLHQPVWRWWWRWGTAVGGVLVLFGPWLIYSWGLVGSFTGDFDPAPPWMVLLRGANAFSGGLVTDPPQLALWFVPVVILAGFGWWILWQQYRSAAMFSALYLLMPIVGIMVLTLRGNAFTERYLSVALPPYLLLVAVALTQLSRRKPPWGWVLSLMAIMGMVWLNGAAFSRYQFDESLAKSPAWRELLNHIAAEAGPNDAIIYVAPLPTITFYNAERLPAYLIPATATTTLPQAADALGLHLRTYDRLWLIPSQGAISPAAGEIPAWLDRHAVALSPTFMRWIHTQPYQSPQAVRRDMTPQRATWQNGITLNGFWTPQGDAVELVAGDSFDLILVWESQQSLVEDYKIFVHLVGPDGLRGQQDNPPNLGLQPTTTWQPDETVFDPYHLTLDPAAPPGAYQIWVGWYHPETGERLLLADGADHLVLGFTVTAR